VQNDSPDWLDGEEREVFFDRGLVALWQKVDVAEAAGNEDAVLDFDPVAATNGLTLARFGISIARSSARHASAVVAVAYAENAPKQIVRYELFREGNGWRIADIRNRDFSLRSALQEFIAPDPGK
jgi:hypothetical protein